MDARNWHPPSQCALCDTLKLGKTSSRICEQAMGLALGNISRQPTPNDLLRVFGHLEQGFKPSKRLMNNMGEKGCCTYTMHKSVTMALFADTHVDSISCGSKTSKPTATECLQPEQRMMFCRKRQVL